MKSNKIIPFLLFVAFASGCTKPGAELMSPPPTVTHDQLSSDGVEIEFNPKVDIIFVVDNSESMLDEQKKLQAAAVKFVESFGKNTLVDYRVGVMTVYDSRRFGPGRAVENPYPEGKLLPLKDQNGAILDPLTHPPYVSRFEGSSEILKSMLNVGVIPLAKGGPQFEELFGPLLVATSAEGNAELNSGFIRPDSHVAIIAVTDEDDSSIEYSVDEFVEQLQNNLGVGRFSMYGVLATNKCPRASFADKPDRLIRAIESIGSGAVFSICDTSYGVHLAKIGSDIRKKVLRKEIPVPTIPEAGTIKVLYGSQEIPPGTGWKYNPHKQMVIINENFEFEFDPAAKFSVSYTRVDERAIRKGHAQPLKGSGFPTVN